MSDQCTVLSCIVKGAAPSVAPASSCLRRGAPVTDVADCNSLAKEALERVTRAVAMRPAWVLPQAANDLKPCWL